MATYTKTCSNNSSYTLRLELSESNVSIANNTSVISYALYLDTSYPRFEDWDVTYKLSIGSEVSINRTEKLSMPPTRGESLKLTSGTKTVTHDSNGAKSLNVSCSISTSTSQFYLPGSASISGQTFVLTTIARKSTMSNVSGTINTNIPLRVSKQNSSFTHTITYNFGNASGTIVSKSSSTSLSWTPPISLYLQIVGKNSGTGKITIETFNGSTSLGSNTYTLTLKASKVYNVPTIDSLQYERGSGSSDATWATDPNGSDLLIKYKATITSGISGNTTKLTVKLGSTTVYTESDAVSGAKKNYKPGIGTVTTYTVTVSISDTIGSSKSWALTVSTIEVPFDINVNLPGMACGKVAETPKAFEIAEGWNIKMGAYKMVDYIVEQGTSGNWTYQKYASGYADLWWRGTVTPTSYTAVGSMVYTNIISLSMPFGVTGNVVVTGSVQNLHMICNTDWSYSGKTVSFRMLRAASITIGAQTVSLRVVGKWKI